MDLQRQAEAAALLGRPEDQGVAQRVAAQAWVLLFAERREAGLEVAPGVRAQSKAGPVGQDGLEGDGGRLPNLGADALQPGFHALAGGDQLLCQRLQAQHVPLRDRQRLGVIGAAGRLPLVARLEQVVEHDLVERGAVDR